MALDEQQRFILQQMRKHIDQRYSSIHEAFLRVDTDRNGSISYEEFATILKINNVRADPKDLARLAEAFDANKDGRVSYEEFCRTIESGPYTETTASRTATRQHHHPDQPAARLPHEPVPSACAVPAPASNPPITPRLGAQLNPSAATEARTQELLRYFRKAVEQCFPSLHRAFIHLDVNRSGYITAQELITLLYDHNVYPTWQELKELVTVLDVNGDGVIDYNEFGRAMHGRVGPSSPSAPAGTAAVAGPTSPVASPRGPVGNDPEAVHRAFRRWCTQHFNCLREAFRRINTSRTGVISEGELLQGVTAVVRGVDPGVAAALFARYDLNQDGLLQYNEFVKAMAYDTL